MQRTFRGHICKALGGNIPPALQEATFVIDKGEDGRAAELIEKITQAADWRGGLLLLNIQ